MSFKNRAFVAKISNKLPNKLLRTYIYNTLDSC